MRRPGVPLAVTIDSADAPRIVLRG